MKIALCGKMASGKSTIAKYLNENYDFHQYSLAGPVKAFSQFLFDLPENQKDRLIFQKVGDGARNHLFDEIWIETLLNHVELYEANFGKGNSVVDDVRYLNEVYVLASKGWKIIKIEIDEDLQLDRLKQTYPNDWKIHAEARTHRSETSLNKLSPNWVDLSIEASNTLEVFTQIKTFIDDNNLSNHPQLQ